MKLRIIDVFYPPAIRDSLCQWIVLVCWVVAIEAAIYGVMTGGGRLNATLFLGSAVLGIAAMVLAEGLFLWLVYAGGLALFGQVYWSQPYTRPVLGPLLIAAVMVLVVGWLDRWFGVGRRVRAWITRSAV